MEKEKEIKNALVSKEDTPEFIGQIIDIFEDFLDDKNVHLNDVQLNDDELYDDDDDNRAIIYGCDYDFLSNEIAKMMDRWNVTEGESTQGMPQKEAYEKIGVPCGDHFKYRGYETRIDNRGILLILDDDYDWLHSAYESCQTEYVIAHPEEIEKLDILEWHIEPYTEARETWNKYWTAYEQHKSRK